MTGRTAGLIKPPADGAPIRTAALTGFLTFAWCAHEDLRGPLPCFKLAVLLLSPTASMSAAEAENLLLTESTLPFRYPRFDLVRDALSRPRLSRPWRKICARLRPLPGPRRSRRSTTPSSRLSAPADSSRASTRFFPTSRARSPTPSCKKSSAPSHRNSLRAQRRHPAQPGAFFPHLRTLRPARDAWARRRVAAPPLAHLSGFRPRRRETRGVRQGQAPRAQRRTRHAPDHVHSKRAQGA